MSGLHELRTPCLCGNLQGVITTKNGQDVVSCDDCGKFQYCAPRTETGRAVRTVSTIHSAIRPRQRARILLRASGHCELCGVSENLHVGHIIPVVSGLSLGMTDMQINDDENLCCLCAECNLGIADQPIPLRLAVGMILARINFAKKETEKREAGE